MSAQRYEGLEFIERGSFGAVYRARQRSGGGLTRQVAIKVLHSEMARDPEVARRLRDEARMLGLVEHHAVVQVFELARLEERWLVVMEYVDGLDLRSCLRLGPLPLRAALQILADVAGALKVAWATPGVDGQPLRLIHRDLKPANIRLTREGGVKVLDFGVARAHFEAREAMTVSLVFGTPLYMAPERFLLQDGPEGDVYALGALLYEVLTGRRFGRSSPVREEHEALLAGQLARLEGRFELPRELIDLLRRLLAWAPQERPSAAEVQAAALRLQSVATGEPLLFWVQRALDLISELGPAEQRQSELSGVELVCVGSRVDGVLQLSASTPKPESPAPPQPTQALHLSPPRRDPWGPLLALAAVPLLGLGVGLAAGALWLLTSDAWRAARAGEPAASMAPATQTAVSNTSIDPPSLPPETGEADPTQTAASFAEREPPKRQPAETHRRSSEPERPPEPPPPSPLIQPALAEPSPASGGAGATDAELTVLVDGALGGRGVASGATGIYPLPGYIPAGVYRVEVETAGGVARLEGQRVVAGASMELRCSSTRAQCRVSPRGP